MCVSFSVSESVEVKREKQGSLSAVLDNGIHLSYSFYGPTGEYRGIALKTHEHTRFSAVCEVLICISIFQFLLKKMQHLGDLSAKMEYNINKY